MIDLHAHTTASDGSFSPTELVQHAKEIGLRAVAITDHDTFGGWDEALLAGQQHGVEIVPGIELSVSDDNGKFHLLGYYVSRDSQLAKDLEFIQYERANRNEIIIEKLRELGLGITLEQVREIAGEGAQVGRPHIARALMDLGAVSSVQEAFNVYLADGALAHATKKVLTPAEAVRLIHEAGGIAIWAHPLRPPSKRSEPPSLEEAENLIQLWQSCGVDGFETYYGAYSSEEAEWSQAMAQKYGLLGTGGSDFHGITKPDVLLGKVNSGLSVPISVLETLKSRLAAP